MSDKRVRRRFGPLVIKALLDIDGRATEGYLTNISVSGAFVAFAEPPAVGTELGIRAVLPWKLGELRVQARVVWRNESASSEEGKLCIIGAGIAFTKLHEGSADILAGYLERFAELAAQLD